MRERIVVSRQTHFIVIGGATGASLFGGGVSSGDTGVGTGKGARALIRKLGELLQADKERNKQALDSLAVLAAKPEER